MSVQTLDRATIMLVLALVRLTAGTEDEVVASVLSSTLVCTQCHSIEQPQHESLASRLVSVVLSV